MIEIKNLMKSFGNFNVLNNVNLTVVTFNDGNDFIDHKDLYEKYFAIYHREKVLTTTKDYGNNAYVNEDFYMMVNDKDKVTKKVLIDKKDNYQNGEVIGSIEIYLNEIFYIDCSKT